MEKMYRENAIKINSAVPSISPLVPQSESTQETYSESQLISSLVPQSESIQETHSESQSSLLYSESQLLLPPQGHPPKEKYCCDLL